MSSICGVLHRDGRPAVSAELEAMVDALAHWQPDRTSIWHQDEIGLGHLALWTTPEAVVETCPFITASGRLAVTADARLDNREDLLRDLRVVSEVTERVVGDAELIARAYEKWGEACVTHFVGDFAFALWDATAKKLFCARDPIGIRPFYYFVDDRRFLFGTEIKAIFTHPAISRAPDPLRLALFIIGGHYERDRTQFLAVRALEPATALVVDARGLRQTRYWHLDPERELRFTRDEDYVEAFEEVFQKAVDARLRANTRVGSMLSGGLDATTMLAFAQQSRQSASASLSAFTWALREGDTWYEPDERPYVEAYLREHPIEHHYITPETSQMFADRPRIRHLQDGPIWDIFAFAVEPMFMRAQTAGIRVLLFGNGGDETASFFAHDYLRALLVKGAWPSLAREIRAEARLSGISPARGFARLIARPALRAATWRHPFQFQSDHAFFLRKATAATTPLAPALAHATGLVEYLQAQRPNFRRCWRHPVRCTQIDAIAGANTFANLAAIKWNNSVLSHVECRYPFFDRRVIEFCVAVPPRQHREIAWSRRLLRRAAASRIPARIAWRRDKTLTIPDLDRGVVDVAESLRMRFARWSATPEIAAYVDVSKLSTMLEQWIAFSRDRRVSGKLDTGAFCRAVLLGSYFDVAARNELR